VPMGENLHSVLERLRAGQPIRILGLGDSLTYGWEVSRGFFDRFVDGLEQRFEHAGLERINAGIPGDIAEGGLRRLGPLAAQSPHLATVQFGLNDCFQGVPPERYERALKAIAEGLVEAGAAVVLCSSCSVAHLSERAAIEPFYGAIDRVGEELGLPVAGLHRYWDERHQNDESLYGWDGIHPTDAGHAIMAEGLLSLFGSEQA
jgi:acyl-CoA thioesterase-1